MLLRRFNERYRRGGALPLPFLCSVNVGFGRSRALPLRRRRKFSVMPQRFFGTTHRSFPTVWFWFCSVLPANRKNLVGEGLRALPLPVWRKYEFSGRVKPPSGREGGTAKAVTDGALFVSSKNNERLLFTNRSSCDKIILHHKLNILHSSVLFALGKNAGSITHAWIV